MTSSVIPPARAAVRGVEKIDLTSRHCTRKAVNKYHHTRGGAHAKHAVSPGIRSWICPETASSDTPGDARQSVNVQKKLHKNERSHSSPLFKEKLTKIRFVFGWWKWRRGTQDTKKTAWYLRLTSKASHTWLHPRLAQLITGLQKTKATVRIV